MGRQVEVDIEYDDLDNERGGTTPGVRAICTECDDEAEAFGTSGRSVRRCLALLRENCSLGEENFYVASRGEDED